MTRPGARPPTRPSARPVTGERTGGGRWMPLARLGRWWLPAAIMAAGMVAVTIGSLRVGGYLIAGALMAAALIRLVSRGKQAGGIAVRGKSVDVLSLVGLSVAVAVAVSLVRGLH